MYPKSIKCQNLQVVMAAIGCQVCDRSTNARMKQMWDQLKQWKAIGAQCGYSTIFQTACQLQVELIIKDKKTNGVKHKMEDEEINC
jgi:hypothetical protein